MAAKTFNPAGASANWSDTTAWGGSIPVSGDTCTITAGKTCIFDVDQSGMAAGLAGLVISGILQCSTTAGAYVLKMDGTSGHNITMTNPGQLLAGSAGSPLPANVTFTINLNGASFIQGVVSSTAVLPIGLFAQQPTHKYCRLTAPAAIAATVLSVDTDLTADAPWRLASARVNVDNINQAQDSESRLISAVSSTQITLTAGLTNAKITGAFIHLIHRNIRITGGTGSAFTNCINSTFQCEVSGMGATSACFSNIVSSTLSGTVAFAGLATGTGIQNSFGCTLSGTISGIGSGVNLCRGSTISGIVSGCTSATLNAQGLVWTSTSFMIGTSSGVNVCSATVFGGSAIGNFSALFYGQGIIVAGAVFTGNSVDVNIARGGQWTGYGCPSLNIGGATIVQNSSDVDLYSLDRVVLYDVAGVADALKAWMWGGTVVPDTGTLPGPTAITTSNKMSPLAATVPVYLDFPVLLRAGVNTFAVYMRKDTNAMSVTPKVQIVLPSSDPFFGGTEVAEQIMADNTNTWQTLMLTYTSTRQQVAILRVLAQNASGNVWEAHLQVNNGFSRSDSI